MRLGTLIEVKIAVMKDTAARDQIDPGEAEISIQINAAGTGQMWMIIRAVKEMLGGTSLELQVFYFLNSNMVQLSNVDDLLGPLFVWSFKC